MKIFVLLAAILAFSFASAQVDHNFNYQGELLDNGNPANGNYDIKIKAFDTESLGNLIGSESVHNGIEVTNGQFTIENVNLGASTFDGLNTWLEISVKKVTENNYTPLTPLQKLHSVPYATSLIDKGATSGQVLTFSNNDGWQPLDPTIGTDNQTLSISGVELSISNGNTILLPPGPQGVMV